MVRQSFYAYLCTAMTELFRITDSEFGTVYIRINRRARRLILRIESNGHIVVSVFLYLEAR